MLASPTWEVAAFSASSAWLAQSGGALNQKDAQNRIWGRSNHAKMYGKERLAQPIFSLIEQSPAKLPEILAEIAGNHRGQVEFPGLPPARRPHFPQ
jgi:hypothetical protein